MTNYALTLVSSNAKIGPMPVSTISSKTCPDACPLKNGGGCYAELGPLGIHWKKVTEGSRGMSFDQFIEAVQKLPDSIWRYAQAGDLPGDGDEIDQDQLIKLAEANDTRPVLCYTHKPLTEQNRQAIQRAEALGFHINISTENLADCDKALDAGFSVVTVVSSAYQRRKDEDLSSFRERVGNLTTPNGTKVAICPATYTDTNCQKCGACSKRRAGNTVIAFPAHGTRKRTVDTRIARYAVETLRAGSD